jgi:hypothetical protein
MPRIRQAAVDATFYLFRRNPQTGAIDGPWGTGFFVIRSSKIPTGHPHFYAVTNWHVAIDAGASIIRVNTHDGKSRFIDYHPDEWKCPQTGDDLAAIDVTTELDPGNDQMIGLFEDMFVTQKEFESFSIGLGEDTFMCGLFTSHHGGERNVPVVRFGNLSMLATEAAPVELDAGASVPCHLVDTRSRAGFSGSPVFVFRGVGSDLLSFLTVGNGLTLEVALTVHSWRNYRAPKRPFGAFSVSTAANSGTLSKLARPKRKKGSATRLLKATS